MVLEVVTKIIQSPNAYTQYIVIPAAMVRDSQYPFRAGEKIRIRIDPVKRALIITSAEEKSVE